VRIVGDLPAGRSTVFSLVRDGKKIDVKVMIDERKESSAADYSKLWPGIEVVALETDYAEAQKLPKGQKGVTVASVIARSPSSALGIRTGDVITAINDTVVKSVGEFYRKLNDPRTTKIQFTVYREGVQLSTLALVRK
ncbi:MAG: PDZ domain-containing protein, partial [Spirochaetales bacterium]